MADRSLMASSGFPGSILEPFLETVGSFAKSGVEKATDAFRKRLNGGDNDTVRLYAAEADGTVQQASTALLLRRLAAAADAKLPGYAYAGTIEVAYTGGDATRDKLRALLPQLEGGDEGKVGEATVKLVALPLADDADEVNLGLTGGAPEGEEEIDFPKELKVKTFLRLQPYRQGGPEQVVVGGDDGRTVDLLEQASVGKATFALRAWAVPEPAVSAEAWAYYTGDSVSQEVKTRAEIVRWLTAVEQTSDFDLLPVSGIDAYLEDGALVDCPMGGPAGERVFEVVAGALASQVNPAGGAVAGRSPVIVVSFSRYEPKAAATLSFDPYLEGLLAGKPTESEVSFLPLNLGGTDQGPGVATVVRSYQSRKAYLDGVKAGERVKFLDQPTWDEVKTAADAIRSKADQVLYLQLGPVPGPLFDLTYANNGLPSVLTGLDQANLALTLDRFYYNVAPPADGSILYPETVLTENNGGTAPFAYQTVADTIAAGLSDWPAKNADNPAAVQGAFVESWRQGDATGTLLKSYTRRLAEFYRRRDNDKLNLGLSYFEYVLATPEESPLPDLFKKLKEGVDEETKKLNLVPDVFPVSTVIGDFFTKLLTQVADGKLVLTVSELKAEPDEENIESILLTGTTDVFGVETQLDVTYTAPENRVASNNKFTAIDTQWSIPGVEWVVFRAPFVEVDVADAELPSVGAVGGTVRAGGEEGIGFTFRFKAPVEDSKWLLQATFNDPLPSIDTFYQLAGGVNIAASLPSPLNVLTDLSLRSFELLYDQGADGATAGKAEYLNFVIGTTESLTLLPEIDLDDLGLDFNIQNPQDVKTRKWSTTAEGTFGFQGGDGVVGVSVRVPAMVFRGELSSGEINLTSLLETFLPDPPIPSDSLSFLPKVRVTAFSFGYQKEEGALDVAAQLNTDFSIPNVISFDQLSFQISRKRADNVVVNTGSVVGQTTILADTPQAFGVAVSADYKGKKAGWTFETHTTTPVKLAEMMKVYLGWDIGEFNLEIETLSFLYEQKNGSWEFNGATNAFKLPAPINAVTAQASAQLGENKGSETSALLLAGKGCQGCSAPVVQSRFIPALMPQAVVETGKYGFVAGKITWEQIALSFSYCFGPKPEDQIISFGLQLGSVVVRACVETREGDEVAVFTLAGESLGSMVEEFVGWVRGGQKFSLPAPWSVLNGIPLDTFELIYNFTQKKVQFGLKIGPIELGFATIKGIGLDYSKNETTNKYEAVITLDGSFFWLQGEDGLAADKLSWDAADPNSTETPPGQGNRYLDLRLLAMGQHVTVPGLREIDKVQDAIALMAKLPETDPCKIPPVVFLPESEWIFGTDFGVLRLEKEKDGGGGDTGALVLDEEGGGYFLTLQVVFNDPILYALRIALAGKPAKILKGLDFQILYVQVSDTVGKYQAEITLPDRMRRITAGAYTIILPVFGISIFTNGDFQVDIGFPWNQDFTRSFTIEAIVYPGIPLLGSAGFYFGKLSSETTNKVPAATNGTFNPVLVFGFGAQIGLGKSIDAGILKAGFSVTAFGIIEGVLAKWNPYAALDTGSSSDSQIQGQYYFWLQGTFGLIGKLYGSIDFAIIKADVNVALQLYVQITFATYEPIPISAVAQVDVEVKVTINLGLFKIKISFSFHMTVKATFVIANGGTPPWQVEGGQQRAFRDVPRYRLSDVRRARQPELFAALAETLDWSNLQPPEEKLGLVGWLAPGLTAAGDEAKTTAEQLACYVTMMFIDAPQPSNEDAASGPLRAAGELADTSFEVLAKQVFRWAAAAVLGPMTPAEVDAKPIQQVQLRALMDELSNPTTAFPIPVADVEGFLDDQVTFTVQSPPAEGDGEAAAPVDGTFFPMPSALKMVIDAYGDSYPGYDYTFGDYNSAPETYLEALRRFFDRLAIKVQEEMDGGAMAANLDAAGGTSIGSYVEVDYFVLLARQMVQAGLDALRDYQYPITDGQSSADVVAWVATENGLVEVEVDDQVETRPFDLGDLFLGNPDHPLTAAKAMTIDGVRYQTQPGESFDAIAAQAAWGGSFSGTQFATGNATTAQILQPGAVLQVNGQDPYTVQPTDTLQGIADERTGGDLAQLLAGSDALTSTTLLAPLAVLALPPVTYTTGDGDTLAGIAARFGVAVADLASNANGGQIDLFVRGEGALAHLDLVHLAQLNVSALIADAQRTPAIQHLASMASRYYLGGLRLPTSLELDGTPAAIKPLHQGMWVTGTGEDLKLPEAAGLFALTGQQVPLPAITAELGDFTIRFDKTAGPSWLEFEGGGAQWPITVSPESDDNRRIQAVLNYVHANRLDTQTRSLGVGELSHLSDATFAMASALTWQAAGPVALPYGSAQGVEDLSLWRLPSPMIGLADPEARAFDPRFAVEIARYDEATGTRTATPAPYYGWATTLPFTVKRLPEPSQSGPASLTTYEIVGADGADVVVLERLLAEVGDDDAAIFSLLVGYAPDGSGQSPEGVQTDVLSELTFGLAQVNLSTVTRPPDGASDAALPISEDTPFPNLLNAGPMEFVRLLWEASITRAGGFYLYYWDEGRKAGLPDRVFNDRGEATLSLVLLYSQPAAEADRNRVADYMNTLATGTSIADDAVVTAVADPVAVQVATDSTQTLAGLAHRYYGDVGQLATDNADLALRGGVKVAVRDGVYEVGPAGTQPGGDPQAIADFFATTVADLRGANPKLDLDAPLPALTAVRLPDLPRTVGTSPGGGTLGSLGAYYGAAVASLGADNRDVSGIFADGGQIDVAGGPVTRGSAVGAGVEPVAAERPAVVDDPDPQTDPATFLRSDFSLLGYQVRTNVSFADETVFSLPAGPTTPRNDAEGAQRMAVPRQLTAEDEWRYDNAVPYPSFALPKVENPSPYRGIGEMLQLDFAWQDLYGNRLITQLSDPQAGDTGPLNAPPLLLGYTDALQGLGTWPSVTGGWTLAAGPGLVFETAFSPDSYEPEGSNLLATSMDLAVGDETPAWRKNAERDLGVMDRLLDQLKDPLGIRYSVETTLLPGGELVLSTAQVADLLAWLESLRAFLADRAGGGTSVLPPARLALTFALDAAAVNQSQIYELELGFTIRRTGGLAAGDFATTPGVLSTTTRVNPGDPSPASTPDDPILTLYQFAEDFEAILSTDDVLWKVAGGVDRRQVTGTGQRSPVWAVRLGLSGTEAISYQVRDVAEALVFAPRPIATELINRPAQIFPYTTGQGIDFDDPSSKTFVGIDMDGWGGQFFSGFDGVLTPQFTGPMQILQQKIANPYAPKACPELPPGAGYLESILCLKERLADLVQEWMIGVFSDETVSGEQLAAIRETFRQQLLVRLGNAYTTRAGVEFLADVVADAVSPGALPPRLFGELTQAGDTRSLPESTINFTSPKIDLQATDPTEPALLPFLVSSPGLVKVDGAVVSSLDLELRYDGSAIEHQIGDVPGIEDYKASSWLRFVDEATNPLDRVLNPDQPLAVPLVLRSYPATPTMASQSARATFSPEQSGTDLDRLLRWTYGFTYSLPFHYPQDTIEASVQFNVQQGADAMLAGLEDAFEQLAEFMTEFYKESGVGDDLGTYLSQVDATTGADSDEAKNASVALVAFQTMVDDIVVAAAGGGGLAVANRTMVMLDSEAYGFKIVEGVMPIQQPAECDPAQPEIEALLVTLTTVEGVPGTLQPPVVQVGDGTYEPVLIECSGTGRPAADYCYLYQHPETKCYLSAADGQSIADRTVLLPGMDVLARQDAWASVRIERNADLVPGKTIAEEFIYKTAEVRLANPAHPTLDDSTPIDLSTIPDETGGAALAAALAEAPVEDHYERSLEGHLTALFDALLAGVEETELEVQTTTTYSFSINPDLSAVPQPVVFQPPVRVEKGETGSGAMPLAQMISELAASIRDAWFTRNQPSAEEGDLGFDLLLLTTLTAEPLPLVRLRNLYLPIRYVVPPLDS